MGEPPSDGERSPSTEDENARLELPSLRLPKLGRKRKARDAEDNPAPQAAPTPTATAPAPPEPEPLPGPAPEPLPQPEPAPQRARVPDLRAARHTDGAPLTGPRGPAPTAPTEAVPDEGAVPDEATDDEVYDQDEELAARQPFAMPTLPARVAAIVTGALVGVVGVALTYLSLQGCNAVRGTKSCGGGPGLVLLMVILVLMALLGGVLLALWAVPEPRSTSLLGVGVLAVAVLLGVLPQEYSVWMFLVVPLICAASYLLAQWITTAFVELPEKGPQHDIR